MELHLIASLVQWRSLQLKFKTISADYQSKLIVFAESELFTGLRNNHYQFDDEN